MNKKIGNIFKGDKVVWMIFFFLCMVSIVEVFSASSGLTYKSQNYIGPIVYHAGTILVGVLVALVYTLWAVSRPALDTVSVLLPNVAPLFYPIVALVAALVLCARPFWKIATDDALLMNSKAKSLARRLSVVFPFVVLAFLAGMFYAGGSSTPSKYSTSSDISHFVESDSVAVPDSLHARAIWNARCSSCHGTDGKFNEKFIREFYPVPQKLTAERFDSLGEDSLVHVIMNGRANMNPYDGRITEPEARKERIGARNR